MKIYMVTALSFHRNTIVFDMENPFNQMSQIADLYRNSWKLNEIYQPTDRETVNCEIIEFMDDQKKLL